MNFNLKNDYVRQKLDLLGYSSHQLPLSAIPLVSAILDDLITTTESLKKSKDEIGQLLEEKKAWELGTEVYKCDNSKLLQELNRLKLELMSNEKKINIENADLKRKLRNLTIDKKVLDEKCSELNQIIYQLNQTDKGKSKKLVKPFVSTVRKNAQFPDLSGDEKDQPCGCKSAINANIAAKKTNTTKEIEKLKNELKHAEDVIAILKKQESEKEREIQRLSCLFVGGRPANALAKDCCYKDVSKITEDLSLLQREKIELTAKIAEYDERHEKLYQKWKQQRDKIKNLEANLKEISEAALYVEREANLRIKNQNRNITELKENLNKNGSTILQELKDLKRAIKDKGRQEEKLLFEIEYLKNKLKEAEKNSSSKNSELVDELIKERDILQSKVKMLCNNQISTPTQSQCHEGNCNVYQTYCQLKDKEAQISKLHEEICQLKSERISVNHPHGTLTVTNNLRRAECERDCALNKAQEMKMENDSFNDKIKVLQDSKIADNKKIIKLEETVSRLKLEIQDLQTSKNPAFTTVKQLREENCELQIKLRSSDEDYKKLNSTYNQMKMLSQQTENVLMNVQNQLEFTKCELSERESQICCLNKSIDCLKEQIEKHTSEISKLKNEKSTVEREKEFYAMTLDKRNEKLHCVESKMESAMCLKESNRKMKTQIDDLNCEIKRLESIVCDTRNENQCLCKQLETTKHHLTNAIHENGRMVDELATITAELNTTKKYLNDSQKESEIIRTKLQSYIHEIERIDGVIALKDNERKQTVCQYKDLECQYKNLDQETNESRRLICEYEQRIKILSDQLRNKEVDIETLEKQLIDLSTEIEMIRNENMNLHVELEAQRNLCEKLDVQKEKQKAEILEYQLSLQELLGKNEKLREEVLMLKEFGGRSGETHMSASYHPTM